MKTHAAIYLSAAAAAIAVRSETARADALAISPLAATTAATALDSRTAQPRVDSDSEIAARIREGFVAQHSANAADARIDVRDGAVTLSGDAVNEEYKALATVYARRVDGVKSVDNRMIVVGTEVFVAGTTADKMDDAAVTARVKTALLLHRSTSAIRTKVKTKSGVVTLSGRARNAAEKDLIGKLVSDLDGVAAVDNQLMVEL